jgi:Zn-dependent protease
MDPSQPPCPPGETPVIGKKNTPGPRLKKYFGPLASVALVIVNFFGKVKLLLLPLLKLFPFFLKTGGTMFLSVWVYALTWGWWFAAGFVALIFIHECGHLVAAKRFGLKVGAPVFIPFMGAFIALKDAPRNAWVEACVGIGGPLLGTVGAGACAGLFLATGNPLFRALAYTGFFLNLFNLAPIGFLDGGRIVTALSPWLWLVGLLVLGVQVFQHPNFILILILAVSAPRVFSLFRRKTEAEKRYFEVTSVQRWTMAFLYFGLIGFLVAGMHYTHIASAR